MKQLSRLRRFEGEPELSSRFLIPALYVVLSTAWIAIHELLAREAELDGPRFGVSDAFFFVAVSAGFLFCAMVAARRGRTLGAISNRRRFDPLLQEHSLPQVLIDPLDGGLVEVNVAAERFYGRPWRQLMVLSIYQLSAASAEQLRGKIDRAVNEGSVVFPCRHRLVTGEEREVEVHAHATAIGQRRLVHATVLDVTEQRRASAEAARTAALLRAVSGAARAMLNGTDRVTTAEQVCRALVEDGQYAMAWVGEAPLRPGERVLVLAQVGDDDGYLASVTITADDQPSATGPTGLAIKTAMPQVAADIATDYPEHSYRDRALAAGFRASVALPITNGGRVSEILQVYSRQTFAFGPAELHYLSAIANELGRAMHMGAITVEGCDPQPFLAPSRQRATLFEIVLMLSDLIEARDPYTAGHQRRVAWLSEQIASTMALSEHRIEGLRVAALLHDIGKIAVPSELLVKPGRLSSHEMALIREHAGFGGRWLNRIGFEWPIGDIVLQHHERLDGSGYPCGLSGEEISLEARIIAVADTVEAMISHRPYRPALPLEVAMHELRRGCGVAYDGAVVEACIAALTDGGYRFLVDEADGVGLLSHDAAA